MNHDESGLASQLLFSKEAAEYLGITVQRLNKLIQNGKITPLKKNSSGTVFHIDELKRRKEELAIFTEDAIDYVSEDKKMFIIDTPTKHEALNFASLMHALGIAEKKLVPGFEEFSKKHDVSDPIPSNLDAWTSFFNITYEKLSSSYSYATAQFEKLKADDEIIKINGSDYPKLLAATEEAPRFLYLRGNKSLLYDGRTVALVGSREASQEAKENTERVALTLGKNGIIIVSGLAKGIDVTAHRTALDNNFNTIAVIGTNLNQYYPNENKEVQLEIEKKGLVISQFPPSMKTERWFFPLRNGVMSGISLATVIMEAGETSGALKQATFALKQGRVVLIPQNVVNKPTLLWPKKYIQKGAYAVRTPKEIIEKLSEKNVYKKIVEPEIPGLLEDPGMDDIVVAEKEEEYCGNES